MTWDPTSPTIAHSYRFELLDPGLGIIGEVHPVRPSITIRHRVGGAVKRTMTGFELPPAEASDVNPVRDRVRPVFVAADGQEWPLGAFCFADASTTLDTGGDNLDGTLHDQGMILNQPVTQPVSFNVDDSVFDAILQVCIWAGFGNAEIDATQALFAAPQAWPASEQTTYYKILSALGMQHAGFFDPWFDSSGRLQLRTVGDLAAAIARFTYRGGPDSSIIRGTIVRSNNLMSAPNRYIVRDVSLNPAPVLADYTVPATAPHSYEQRNYYATRYIDVQGIDSNASALAIALNASRQDLDSFEEIAFSSIIDPRHESFEVMNVIDADYLETEWSIRLDAGGVMQHKGKRIKHSEVRPPGGVIGVPPVIPAPGGGGDPDPDPDPIPEQVIATYQAEDMELVEPVVNPPDPTGTGRWEINAQGAFIAPDGTRRRLVGANGAIQEFGPNDAFIFNYPIAGGGGARSFLRVADIQNWGWNCVRLCSVSSASPGGISALVSRVAAFVQECAAAQIVVLATDFTAGVGTNPTPGSSAANAVDAYWTALVDAIGDNPWLWINYMNEPMSGMHPNAGWLTLANHAYNLIRSRPKGANTMIVQDAANSGQDGVGCVTSGNWSSYAAGKHHTALSWHAYMAGKTAANIESDRTTMNNANVPWLVGEFAYQPNHPGTACCGGTYDNQRAGALKIINEWIPAGESALWWIATGDASNAVQHSLRSPDGTYQDYSVARSEAGEGLWTVGRQSHIY